MLQAAARLAGETEDVDDSPDSHSEQHNIDSTREPMSEKHISEQEHHLSSHMEAPQFRSDDGGSKISLTPLFEFVAYSHFQSNPQQHEEHIATNPFSLSSAIAAPSNSATFRTPMEAGSSISPLQIMPPVIGVETVMAPPPPMTAPSSSLHPKPEQMSHPVNDLQPLPQNVAKSETTTLTQKGIIVFETTTTTVDPLPETNNHMAKQELVASHPLSTSFESAAPPMFAYMPPSPPQSTFTSTMAAATVASTAASSAVAPIIVTPPRAAHDDTQGIQSALASQTHPPFQSVKVSQLNRLHEKPTASVRSRSARISSTATSTSTGTSAKGLHGQTSSRLSDGYVILISIAVLFVFAVLFYFYMRRRKGLRAKTNNANNGSGGRSILSSHSGVPSAGAEEGEKYYTAGTQPSHNMPPDSGASVDYRNKHGKGFGGKNAAEMQTTRSPTDQQDDGVMQPLSINYYGYRSPDITAETATGNACERSAFASAKSDIYDCILAGKKQSMQFPVSQTAKGSHTVMPIRAAAKRGAISLDHVKLQPPLPAHISDRMNSPIKDAQQVPLENQPNTDQPLHSSGQPSQGCSQTHAGIDSKPALLDTTSANPGLGQTANRDPLGIKIKPRKLVRDPSRRPSNSSKSKLGSHAMVPKNQTSPSAKAEDSRNASQTSSEGSSTHLAQKQQSPDKKPTKIIRSELVSPPHTPNLDDLSQPKMPPNFISLLDSNESLSDSYQFAVRHKPPLGPLHAVEPHTPALPDELRIKRGEELHVIGEFADGWVLAINNSRAKECGMIPRRCLFFPTAPFMTRKSVLESLTPPDSGSPEFCP
ncbi:hypothetical protein H4R20_001928 [Coemansia guatemalensis]|uniref:SH3 domain-containing protein n=1 Tax=Coemansia guatemalensis TaxID=2761395 RepID=A0A9W8HW45_9FUNG|nr:hypothetical protein H4R20_001928 [Coemansia guatemalensis]